MVFRVSTLLLLLSVQVTVSAPRPFMQTKQAKSFSSLDEVVPGVVIVKFRTPVDDGMQSLSRATRRSMTEAGATEFRRMFPGMAPVNGAVAAGMVDLSRLFYADIDPSLDPRDVASRLGLLDDVEYAEPKFMNYLNDTPNDPQITNQSGYFTRLNAFNGWTIAKGSPTVAIATVDGGTYWQHEDLVTNLWINTAEDLNGNGQFDPSPAPGGDQDGVDQDGNGFVDDVIGWNFSNGTNNPRGLAGTPQSADHGTNTASMFGATTNNGIGMAGSSWGCRVMPICTASPTSDNGIAFGYEGIVYAYLNGAKVINCSWGRVGGYSAFEQDVINAATQAGALVVAAAGNGGPDQVGDNNDILPNYPPNYLNVLGVGATNSTSDVKAGFSNYGVTIPVYAPGVNILGALDPGGYVQTFNSGTSFSSPLVAGLAGILRSQHPTWTPRQIATQIRVTCDSIDAVNPSFAGNMGRGRVNFARALTESHPGIEIVSSSIRTTHGSALFLPGDTVVAHVIVRNILFTQATNLSFVATSSDASLSVLQGAAVVGTIAPDQEIILPDLTFRVGSLTVAKDVVIRLGWRSNTNDDDQWAFKVTVFPATPLWESQVSPTATSLFSIKAVSGTVAWASGGNGSATGPAVIRTSDGGATWASATGNLPGSDLYCITAIDANRAWVGTGAGKIYATSDGGATWSQQVYPGTQSPFINGVWMFANGTGFAEGDPASGGRFVVLKTTDFGASWVHTNEPVGGSSEAGWNNSFWMTDENHIWFGTNANKVWRSTDAGATWSSAASGTTNSYGVSFKDGDNGVVIHDNGTVRVTTNGGASWVAAATPAATFLAGTAYLPGTNSIWVATGTNPYRSTNSGSSWAAQTLYPFTGQIQHISFADTTAGWVVTSNGEVLRYRVPGSTGIGEGAGLPDAFAVSQNFPNPFNPATTISFTMLQRASVSLRVYDLLGREVATLVDGFREAGSHTVRFDATGLPSGTYFYRVASGTFMSVHKMLLLK